jgi:2-deoxy-D-gluconate 3-dehydrogenase
MTTTAATDWTAVAPPSFRLDGRLAVITGSSDGLGRTFALAFAQVGATVLLTARRKERLDEVKAAIEAKGGKAHVVAADLSKLDDIDRLAAEATKLARASGEHLVLVNNAGFGFTVPALKTTEEDWDKIFDTQAKATFFCCQKMAPLMIERGYGKIINLTSTWGFSSDMGKVAYGSAKAAISRITAGLSTEWAPLGVRVKALAPTATMSDFTRGTMAANPERAQRLVSHIKLGRFAEMSDHIGPAIFLASAASDFVTGHTLFSDGGWLGASF